MAEQMGTPNSSADLSVNGGRGGAPKDKNCPFCHQAFTSSSLGRHLDLYIKEKNPKVADGVHSVDEIKKLRGSITRRQPRNSTSRREDSTPAGTPGGSERRSPNNDSDMAGSDSPSLRRDDGAAINMMCMSRGIPGQIPGNRRPNFVVNGGTWESTGVMNHIPQTRNGETARSWDGDQSRDGARRLDGRNRSVGKQMLAKTTFEQKQKMMEALDNAKAAELAVRELLGGFRAAKQRIEGPNVFDYDPFSLDFPALTLHCLPPPPTLYASTPIPNSTSWSILPPDELQYQALRKHFSSEFHRYRISLSIATTAPHDDLSYPPQETFHSLENIAALHVQAEADAQSMEARISEHLRSMFGHWNSLPPNKRTELWTLELARNIGRKSEELSKLKKEKELLQQETAHSKLQVEELSRLQQPREFRIQPPSPLPVDSRLMTEMGKMGATYKGVGFQLMDRSVHLDTAVERAIGRWKSVVKQARGGSGQPGMVAQKPLDSNNNDGLPRSNSPQLNTTITSQPLQEDAQDLGSDQDADGDADMEEDDTFVDLADVNAGVGQRAPEASMSNTTNFRLANGGINMQGVVNAGGGGNSRGNGMEGMENQSHVQGYLRIGA
ncbi:hypothetical protein SBOR_4538 [Sclerotinia borealis F-4128]|uniref:Uncharacterized protein n=1 Tax=Sclerotinia borealis (strain F-4128) TaxID=1432307 RepID=W9CGK5_SCLBF|nr:hypothetical protein SBOR_4538 [Sclerotinia borealis F-4128]